MEEKKKKEPQYNPARIMLNLVIYHAVGKFKSIRRAMRRGHVTSWGEEVPKRPFNNRGRTDGREIQITKERIYEQLKYRRQTVSV